MDLNIQGRNIEITRSVREHVTAKLASLDRHLPAITRAEVEMASESTRSQQDRVVVQVSLNVGGDLLRAQRRAGNARAAVNATVEALDRQLNRWKAHTYRSERQARHAPDADAVVEAMASVESGPADGDDEVLAPHRRSSQDQAVQHGTDVGGGGSVADAVPRSRLLHVPGRGHQPVQRALPAWRRKLRNDPARRTLGSQNADFG